MRHFLAIISFIFLTVSCCCGQSKIGVQFPDSLKKSFAYFSPYITYGVLPKAIGVLKVGEPYDSMNSIVSQEYLWQIEYNNEMPDSIRKKNEKQNGLKVIVDTSQEINQEQQFYQTYKDDSMYASPRYLTLINSKGVRKLSLNRDKTVYLAATPIYILNPTNEDKKIYDQDFHINIIQEVLDLQGNWREIEMYQTGFCGMAWGWKTLHPNHMVVTSVLKYGGSLKTLARIKFDNGTIYYSEPYNIELNPQMLSGKIRTTLSDGFIMELK